MGSMKELVVPAFDATTTACRVMASLERAQVFVRRAETLDLVATRTRLLSDLATHRTLTGDVEAARAASEGTLALVQLFDRGTQDRKELETLICAALRDKRAACSRSRRANSCLTPTSSRCLAKAIGARGRAALMST